MKENLNYKLFNMSLMDKLFEVFNKFPYNSSMIEPYKESINEDFVIRKDPESRISYELSTPCYLSLYVSKVGTFTKNWDKTDDVIHFTTYSLDFYKYDNIIRPIPLMNITSEKISKICKLFFPFLLSHGKDKSGIPLLISHHEELAKFALEF